MFATGETVGLAEWIIDDTCLFLPTSTVAKHVKNTQDMSLIDDPLGQTHSPSSSDHYFHAKFVLFWDSMKSTDETRVKIMITIGRGSASWIKRLACQIDNF